MNLQNIRKINLVGDLHLGIKNNSVEWLEIQKQFLLKFLFQKVDEDFDQDRDILILEGDIFHSRESINVRIQNEAFAIFKQLAAKFKRGVYIIVGNHDVYYKDKTEVNSLKALSHLADNIHVFEKPETLNLNGEHSFLMLPWIEDVAEIRRRKADIAIIGAPFDDAVTHRPGTRFGPRAIREAQYQTGTLHSLQVGVEPFTALTAVDAGDAVVYPGRLEHGHGAIYRKVREVAETGAIPIVLGGDHSITWPNATAIAEMRWPQRIGILHFDAHADASIDGYGSLHSHGSPMRRLIESGAVLGKNFVQVGLRGYFPDSETLGWMREHGMRSHFMTEIEERGSEAVIATAIAEALDGPDAIWISLDIDVVDPGLAPGTGTPEPGGMLSRELLRGLRQIAAQVPIAGMDIVEVSPPYDWAESTAMIANRAALEVISALAKRKESGETIRWEPSR